MITHTITSSEDSVYCHVSDHSYALQPPIPSGGGGVTPRSHITLHYGYRNINRFVIGFPFRVRLRSRLTLVRLAFSRKPWVFGERVSTRFVVTHAYIFFSRRSRIPHDTPSPPKQRTCINMSGRGAFQSALKVDREVCWSVWKRKCRHE